MFILQVFGSDVKKCHTLVGRLNPHPQSRRKYVGVSKVDISSQLQVKNNKINFFRPQNPFSKDRKPNSQSTLLLGTPSSH